MAFDGPHVGKSGKHYFNPKQMESHGDGPEEGHPNVHHIEIHPHGPSPDHPHHAEAHHHDGQVHHLGEHPSYHEAAAAGHAHLSGGQDGLGEGAQEEMMEEKVSPGIHAKVRRSESGAY